MEGVKTCERTSKEKAEWLNRKEKSKDRLRASSGTDLGACLALLRTGFHLLFKLPKLLSDTQTGIHVVHGSEHELNPLSSATARTLRALSSPPAIIATGEVRDLRGRNWHLYQHDPRQPAPKTRAMTLRI